MSPRLPDAEDGGEAAERIRARRGGELHALDRLLLHSPPVADGWNALLGAIRERTTLPGHLRELAVLRVAVLNGASYEWAQHEPVARREGLSDEALAAIRAGDRDRLGELEALVLDLADAMTRDIEVPQPLFDALADHFDARGLVELTATIATYNLVSRFLVAMELGS